MGNLPAALSLVTFLVTTPVRAEVPCVNDEYVTVAIRSDSIVLATLALKGTWDRDQRWRFRTIPLAPALSQRVEKFSVGHSAAQARLRIGNRERRVDLTRQIIELGDDDHYKPGFKLEDATQPCAAPFQKPPADQLNDFLDQHGYDAGPAVDWAGYSVRVDPRLYAPVLQFADNEHVQPTAFGIWDRLKQHHTNLEPLIVDRKPAESERDRLFRAFKQSVHRGVVTSTVYYVVENKPGSWVVQYWLYYPFDVGGVGEHLHDSEHVFVEVDKLGGSVRRVAGAGHGDWAPNNIFHTFFENAPVVELPLHVIVERGKHATAPDIDRDGLFTPGIDSNNYRDTAKVWGVRDTTGVTDSDLRAFSGTMMVRRQAKNSSSFASYRSIWGDPPSKQSYELKCLATTEQATNLNGCELLPPMKRCNGASPSCAGSQVSQHPDFKDSREILKPSIFPRLAVQFLASAQPTADDRTRRSIQRSLRYLVGGTVELSAIRLPFPGRFAGNVILDDDNFGIDGFSGRYEWLVTNLFGLYGGLSYITDDLGDLPAPDVEDPNRATWLGAGGLYEMPLRFGFLHLDKRLVGQFQGGLLYNNYFGMTWEIRGGVSFTFRTPNREFGIKADKPNPY